MDSLDETYSLAQSALVAKKGSPKGASKGSGTGKNSEFTCWYCERKGHRASECHKRQKKGGGKRKSKGVKKGDGKGVKNCRSKETNAFEVDEQEPVSETGCFDMASVDLNALEIGSVHVPEGNRKLRLVCSTDSVPEHSGTRLPYAPDTRQSQELQASVGQSLARSGCKKGTGQTQRWVSSMREPTSGGHAQSSDGCVGDERHGSRRVLSQKRQRNQSVRVPQGSGTKLELERVNGVFELLVELVPHERSTSNPNKTKAFS